VAAAVLFDVDGTLVDSNDAHAHAWTEAFAEEGVSVDFARVRRAIGMGGDKLMRAVSGIDEGSSRGKRISARRGEIFTGKYLPTIRPLPGARELVATVKARGLTAVAASSAKKDELKALLDIAGARSLMDAATSSDDAEKSKPDPDIVHAALKQAKAAAADAVMIGDTPYDIEAASRAGVAAIAFRSGGWDDDDLRGAVAIYDGPADLLGRLDMSPLARAKL
jgi:phosphoglycolate phosphatase-like HAD superfamily hydrolase